MSKFSIVIPCFNNLAFSLDCIESVFRNTSDFELILVNNGSTDDTSACFDRLSVLHHNVQVITFPENTGFSHAVNSGVKISKGEYIIILNNDTLPGPDWAIRLLKSLFRFRKVRTDPNFMFIGPVSNNASGAQSVNIDLASISSIDTFSLDFYKNNVKPPIFSHFLSGFCFLFDRKILDSLDLFDENFTLGGFEDNDLFLRAALAGFKACVDESTFVFHHGQRTLSLFPAYSSSQFIANNLYFIKKHFFPVDQNLCVLLRVKDGSDQLSAYVDNISHFTDSLIVVDNDSTDDTASILHAHPDIVKFYIKTIGFNEARDRQLLLSKASVLGFDWALSLDIDERIPAEFSPSVFQRLMHPANPDILAYSLNIFTFFEGLDYIRQDHPWGELRGVRLFRVLPNQRIDIFGKNGLHCSHCPSFSSYNTRYFRMPVLHYGYVSDSLRASKSAFYSKIDQDPFQPNVGPFGYKHLTTSEVLLSRYSPDNSVALAVLTGDDAPSLFRCLYNHYSYFDEIHVLHTGKHPDIAGFCKLFGAHYYSTVFSNDFSHLRNLLKSKISTKWILFLDTDEYIDYQDFSFFSQMILRDVDGYLFIVWNFQPDNTILFSDNVRLVRNIDKIYWTHPVHESVSLAVQSNHLDIIPSPVAIKHTGFLNSSNSKKLKSKLYLAILEKELKKNPKDASIYFHLAFHYFENSNPTRGFEYLNKVLKLDPKFFLSSKELGLRYLKLSVEHFENCLKYLPKEHYYYNFLSQIHDYTAKALNIQFSV